MENCSLYNVLDEPFHGLQDLHGTEGINRMEQRQVEQRIEAVRRSCGVCSVCGKPLSEGQSQYAHKIPQKEMFIRKYGTWIIDHTLNGKMVCSLGCNASVDVGSSYGNHLDVISDILIAEYVKMWGIKGLSMLSDKLIQKMREHGIN